MIYFKIVKVKTDYCDYLRQFDFRVSYNKDKKELRPFIGALFVVKDREYFAPLSSPKEKHLKMKNGVDFLKLDEGRLGAINFNNMIPVKEGNYELLDLDAKGKSQAEKNYHKLLIKQFAWLNDNSNIISKKSHRLYKLYLNGQLPENIVNRCCNFPLLEEKCDEYNSKQKVSV